MKQLLLIGLFAYLLFELQLGFNINLGPGLSIKNAFLYVLLLLVVVRGAIRDRGIKIHLVGVHGIFLALIAYAVMSWAINVAASVDGNYPTTASFISLKSALVDQYIFLFVFLNALSNREDVLLVARLLVVTVLVSSVLTLLDFLNLPDFGLFLEDEREGRVQGPVGQPNQYGGFLAFWIPVGIGWYLTRQAGEKVLMAIGIVVSIGLLILTGSRGALVGAVGGSLLATVFLRHHLHGRLIAKGATAVVLLAIAIALVVGTQFADVVVARLEVTVSGDVSTVSSGRIDIWANLLSEMLNNPASFIVGYGWDSLSLTMDRSAHNAYFTLLFELGIVGLGLYLALLYVTIRCIRSGLPAVPGPMRSNMIAAIFAICSVAVLIMFGELHRSWLMIWAYLGLILRLAIIAESDTGDGDPVV